MVALLLVGTARPAAALVCGKASRLRHVSPAVGPAARAGPLSFVIGSAGRSRAVAELGPDYPTLVSPTKVLIHVRRPLRAPITLRGSRCSDGRALRFFYRNVGEPPRAGPAAELEGMGDRVATLAAGEPPITVPALGYGGYMLFSGPGKWKVFVRRGRRLLGTATIRVVAQ